MTEWLQTQGKASVAEGIGLTVSPGCCEGATLWKLGSRKRGARSLLDSGEIAGGDVVDSNEISCW